MEDVLLDAHPAANLEPRCVLLLREPANTDLPGEFRELLIRCPSFSSQFRSSLKTSIAAASVSGSTSEYRKVETQISLNAFQTDIDPSHSNLDTALLREPAKTR